MRGLYETGLFVFRALAVIMLAGAVVESIEGEWLLAVVFGSLSLSMAVLAALASTEGHEDQ